MDANAVPLTPPAPAAVAAAAPSPPAPDPARWVELHGDCLFRFALMRVRDRSRAEDLVQETFLAAMRAKERFAGRSAEQSWLVGILKNKIVDYFRKAGRETSFTDLEFLKDEQSDLFIQEGLFAGGWHHETGPMDWGDAPGNNLDRAAFWQSFHECMGKLPPNVARVFQLREIDDLPTGEICAAMNVTPNNLWVMLHRARMALRRCLELNWFGRQPE
jgi:RNA polymerase sigma-70 factor, ECF subfamily